eukprot:3366260-Ditylum_brightwellii.AAC.1
MPTSYAPPPQARLLLSTSSPYLSSMMDCQRNGSSFDVALSAVLKCQNVTQGPASYAVTKTLLKGKVLTVFEQAELTH